MVATVTLIASTLALENTTAHVLLVIQEMVQCVWVRCQYCLCYYQIILSPWSCYEMWNCYTAYWIFWKYLLGPTDNAKALDPGGSSHQIWIVMFFLWSFYSLKKSGHAWWNVGQNIDNPSCWDSLAWLALVECNMGILCDAKCWMLIKNPYKSYHLTIAKWLPEQ